jgi:hypothetical protein
MSQYCCIPLISAVSHGRTEIVKSLIAAGASLNVKTRKKLLDCGDCIDGGSVYAQNIDSQITD